MKRNVLSIRLKSLCKTFYRLGFKWPNGICTPDRFTVRKHGIKYPIQANEIWLNQAVMLSFKSVLNFEQGMDTWIFTNLKFSRTDSITFHHCIDETPLIIQDSFNQSPQLWAWTLVHWSKKFLHMMTPVTFTTVYTEFSKQHKPRQKALCEARKSPWCIVGNLLMWNLSSEAPRCSTTA